MRESIGRQTRQYLIREGGEEAGQVVAAYAQTEAAVDIADLAARRLAGERAARTAPRRPVSLDEDLTQGRGA